MIAKYFTSLKDHSANDFRFFFGKIPWFEWRKWGLNEEINCYFSEL